MCTDTSKRLHVEIDHKRNLENFTLVWLELNVNYVPNDIYVIQKDLEQVINRIVTFDDISRLKNWLETNIINDKIVLILSGGFETDWQIVADVVNNILYERLRNVNRKVNNIL